MGRKATRKKTAKQILKHRKAEVKRVRQASALTVGAFEKIVKAELEKRPEEKKPPGKPPGTKAFQSVMRARELMAESAAFGVRMLKKSAKIAADRGDSRPTEFLLKHVAVETDKGKLIRPVHASIDKLEGGSGPRQPTINIGWIVAPDSRPTLPVVDVLALPEHDSD